MNRSTIAAISTPYGSGGIGIIRISGAASLEIADGLFRRSKKPEREHAPQGTADFISHRMYHGYVVDPESKGLIDEVMLVVMRAPRSYTREDVVEIQSHAGYVVLGKIFECVIRAGARIAEPGEFTKRAFLNGRIDLTQAEGVIDVINAKTTTALRMAVQQMDGRLKERLERLYQALEGLLVELEAAIDFPEESGDVLDGRQVLQRIEGTILPEITNLLGRYRMGHHFRDGVRMAVVGRPNVGKSSLLNCLTQKDRAIVTPIPGTTRDVIEEPLSIGGLPVVVVDTAGLQETEEEVERRGIQKTFESIERADLVLFVVDNNSLPVEEELRIYEQIRHKTHLVVLNKIDLSPGEIRRELPSQWNGSRVVGISALRGDHIDELKQQIWAEVVGEDGISTELGAVPNSRHMVQIEASHRCLTNALSGLKERAPSELISIDLKEALESVGAVLGHECPPDILDQVFSRFCIGK